MPEFDPSSRRDFLKKAGGALLGAFGLGVVAERITKHHEAEADVYDPDEFDREHGQTIMPETKELQPYFATDGKYLQKEALHGREKELQEEWKRIIGLERAKINKEKFANQDFFVRRYFKILLDNSEKREALARLAAQAVEKYQMPPEILLGVIGAESGGNPQARSKSKPSARGILQLVPETAREMGLRVETNDQDEVVGVDERYDAAKCLDAGAKYLYKLKDRFDSWGLALIAYCEGQGQLNAQLKKRGIAPGKTNIVELYSREHHGLGTVHPFQYPFHVYELGRQMIRIINGGEILSVEKLIEPDEDETGETMLAKK